MSAAPIVVWSAGRSGGVFPTRDAAVRYCRTLTNDHRREIELTPLATGALRYVGPRGRRHGTRLVAFLGERGQLELLGVDVNYLLGAWSASV